MERDGRSNYNHRVRLVAKQRSENSNVLSTDLMARGAARGHSGDGGANRGSRGGNYNHQSQNQGGGGGRGTTRALRPSQQGQNQGGGGGGGGGGVSRRSGPSQIGGQHNKQVKVSTQSKVTVIHRVTKQKKCVIAGQA